MVVGRKRQCLEDIQKVNSKGTKCMRLQVPTLIDLAAKCTASTYPYQEIEEKLGFVPTPVQRSIMYHSFPNNENCIELYSSNKIHVNAVDVTKQPFYTGLKLLESKAVFNVIQIGFHISACVREKVGICNRQKTFDFKCSMNFDRNCITSTECSCNTRSHLWCSHVVAVALYRIRNPNSVPIKPPISDSVVSLKKEKLQKLLLTLVTRHSNLILPSVQSLLDELREPESEINLLPGIPDPTAGGSCDDENTWHIDGQNIQKQIQTDLSDGSPGKNIISLMNKVREMMSVKDRNYINLLCTITDSILSESTKRPQIQNCQRTKKIYDELQTLWYCVIHSPSLPVTTKQTLVTFLEEWLKCPNCPKENIDDDSSPLLLEEVILKEKNNDLFAQAAAIEALNLCNQKEDALKIAKAFLQNIKDSYTSFDATNLFNKSTEPIFNTFNTLLDNGHENQALELALISLSRSFNLPKGEYAQIRLTHRYEKLISLLEVFDIAKPDLQSTLLKYATKLYEDLSAMVSGTMEVDILPNHCLARFLFDQLLNIDCTLAFNLSLLMLPLNLNKSDTEEDDDVVQDGMSFNGTFCYISSHLEYQQGELAAGVLKQCDKHPSYLKLTLTSVLEDISQPCQLLKLAKLCQSIAVAEHLNFNIDILNASFELGVRSIRLITDTNDRKSCIRWLVSCAVDTGRQAVDFLIRNWTDLFLPKEISDDVAPMLTSQPVSFHLRLTTLEKREELFTGVRNMTIEACIKDPVPCVLFALTLCEESQESFELVCQITLESSDRFNTAQLFSVARYLESKNHLHRAFKIGVQALKKLDIGALDCQHPAICDVLWISTLASNLGINELTHIVPVLENCIHNPLLLTEIAERCSNKAYVKNTMHNFSCHKEPLNRLVASAQKLFVQDIELKLRTITRKNYKDFTNYLLRIKKSFLLSEDGQEQFQWLIDYIMTSQKGKKKLHEYISQTFAATHA